MYVNDTWVQKVRCLLKFKLGTQGRPVKIGLESDIDKIIAKTSRRKIWRSKLLCKGLKLFLLCFKKTQRGKYRLSTINVLYETKVM